MLKIGDVIKIKRGDEIADIKILSNLYACLHPILSSDNSVNSNVFLYSKTKNDRLIINSFEYEIITKLG